MHAYSLFALVLFKCASATFPGFSWLCKSPCFSHDNEQITFLFFAHKSWVVCGPRGFITHVIRELKIQPKALSREAAPEPFYDPCCFVSVRKIFPASFSSITWKSCQKFQTNSKRYSEVREQATWLGFLRDHPEVAVRPEDSSHATAIH